MSASIFCMLDVRLLLSGNGQRSRKFSASLSREPSSKQNGIQAPWSFFLLRRRTRAVGSSADVCC